MDEEQYDEFVPKYWQIFDSDNSGTLNFDEYMYFCAGFLDDILT